MSNFFTRTLTGLLFVSILIVSINLNVYTFFSVFLACTILGLWEFYKLAKKTEISPQFYIGLTSGVILFTSCFLHAYKGLTWGFLVLCLQMVLLFISELYRKRKDPITNIAYTLIGLIYVGVPFSLLNYLAFPFEDQLFHPEIVMGIFVMIWANDTGAYLVGSRWGKHRLFERISPKKSWEGSIGGALTTLIAGWIISQICLDLSLFQWEIVALTVIIFGSLGDLVESMFKRSLHIKDSGTILPGHGGILDRFDAVFLAAPMVFVYLRVIKDFFN